MDPEEELKKLYAQNNSQANAQSEAVANPQSEAVANPQSEADKAKWKYVAKLLTDAFDRVQKYKFLDDVREDEGVKGLYEDDLEKAMKYEDLVEEVKQLREEASVSGIAPIAFPEYSQDKRKMLEAVQMFNHWMVDILFLVDRSLGEINNFWTAITVFVGKQKTIDVKSVRKETNVASKNIF